MSLPSTPSRFSKGRDNNVTPSKTKTIDVGKPLGDYDTNTVRDRVRQWQAQGGGVVTAEDVGAEDQNLETDTYKSRTSENRGTPRTPSKVITDPDPDSNTPSRSGRKSAKLDETKSDRNRSRSAPGKRIVSDGHWRRKKSPPKGAISSKVTKDATLVRAKPDHGIRVAPTPERKTDERRRRAEQKGTPKNESVGGDDGIRVYVTPPGSSARSERTRRRSSDHTRSGHGSGSDVEGARSGRLTQPARQTKRPTPEKSPRSAVKENSKTQRSSAPTPEAADDPPQSVQDTFSDGRASTRSKKAGKILSQVFGDSRKIFAKHAPESIPTPRVPSIEAWLNETPDPFVDTDDPPLEVIPPLRPSPEKRKPTPRPIAVEDPNHIWDGVGTKEGTRRAVNGSRRRMRIPSSAIYEHNPFPADFDSDSAISNSGKGAISASKFVDLVKDPSEQSSPSLKRRSARKSVSSPIRERRKSQMSREPTTEDDVASTRSSDLTTSSLKRPKPTSPMRPPGLINKRPFPSTGNHRLSTIASVETFDTKKGAAAPSLSEFSERTVQPSIYEEGPEEARDNFDSTSLQRNHSRLTKHADLISILSLPRAGNKSIQSARSIRTNRSRLATATIGDLMQELTTDEGKYMRELRTLVDGVIPVLLTCVLSKSDSAVAAGLFQPSNTAHENPNFTRPIVDMGIALERLKTLHKRIPQGDATAFLTWAHSAQRVYAEYLKAWRMGFQDVVVNLAPAAEPSSTSSPPSTNGLDLDEGLPRNEEGDVVNGDGERVDVAFLLKRPLVRLKYLAKTLKGINFIKPSAEADNLATKYQCLVEDARRRSNEERARLEDEAASNIDPTRTRDPRTLAPLTGVAIDRTRRVRARDNFNLALQHSSGQRVDCRVELLLRDEATDLFGSGDLLICEVDETGRWLLFPPIQFALVSARNGDLKGEIVVMIRGFGGSGAEWQESFSLRSEDEHAGFEWVQMLGLEPVPPKISRSQSFMSRHQRNKTVPTTTAPASLDPAPVSATPGKSRTPSPREVDVPIGEQANDASKGWNGATGAPPDTKPQTPTSRESTRLQKKSPESFLATPSRSSTNYVNQVNDLRSLPSQKIQDTTPPQATRTPRSFKEALGLSGTSTSVGLRRTRAKRQPRHGGDSPSNQRSGDSGYYDKSHPSSPETSEVGKRGKRASPSTDDLRSLSPEPKDEYGIARRRTDTESNENNRPPNLRSRSSVPPMELPYMPKARTNSPPTTPIFEPEEEPEWSISPETRHARSAAKLTKKWPVGKGEVKEQPRPLPPTTRKSPTPVQLNDSKTPTLEQAKTRRSSSPLKHEYEPSTASESPSDSDASTVERLEAVSISDSSEDEELEEEDAPTPLLPLAAFKRPSKPMSRGSLYSVPNGSIKPSESASQAPYKTVPVQPTKAAKTIASIFSWSDTGLWQSLHPDECSIVITPGLIEAYEMSAAHSSNVPLASSTPVVDADAFSEVASNLTSQNDDVKGERPLVALELTPLVPLRRGTAIDISIRSPPTPNSQITSGNNIMFRSRNPEECEALYALINHSRINNPTFIALQNARGPYGCSNSFSSPGGGRLGSRSSNSRSSWFGGWGRSSSYRASSAPTPSIAPSESSIGSMSSAFSALKRFGRGSGGGMFNISRSTISSRTGSRANSVYTSSDNSSGSGTSSPLPPGLIAAGREAPIGLSEAKIRLYVRETASKWRDMGSARLTIMRADKSNISPDGKPITGLTKSNEKRIVINGKTKGEVLLDVQLGESCFERVARTGIAVSVWENVVGPNGEVGVVGAVGGVTGGKATVYMIQMKSEAETAYTFSLVGRLRY